MNEININTFLKEIKITEGNGENVIPIPDGFNFKDLTEDQIKQQLKVILGSFFIDKINNYKIICQ